MTKTTKEKMAKEDMVCHDCGKRFHEGDMCVPYELSDKTFYKCSECFAKDKTLRNFQKTEVYSRIVGYIRPVEQWNVGKATEYTDRKVFDLNSSACCG